MTVYKTQIYKVIEEALKKPPIPHEPERQSLKAWAMYCLRDRGFKVIYAQNADFAVEDKNREKMYFKVYNQVSNSNDDLDDQYNWIICDRSEQNISQNIRVIPSVN
ncbi:MAG: hypothetical protein AAF378_08240 [Cyanobacteria bacterium P01_A01_bin.84]